MRAFLCPSFLLLQEFELWSVLSNFSVTIWCKDGRNRLDRKDCRCLVLQCALVSTLPPVPATNRRVVQARFAVEGFEVVFISCDKDEKTFVKYFGENAMVGSALHRRSKDEMFGECEVLRPMGAHD